MGMDVQDTVQSEHKNRNFIIPQVKIKMLKNDEGKKTTCCLYITAKLLSGDDNPDVTDIAAL